MSQTGCAFLALNVSTFINSEFEANLENKLNATVTLTEEGTGESLTELTANSEIFFNILKLKD